MPISVTSPAAQAARRSGFERDTDAADPQSAIREDSLDDVHGRIADEGRDKPVRRPLVDLVRRRDLLQFAGVHHRDEIGHGERLGLIVGHVERGRAEPVAQPLDFAAHAQAKPRVEVGQRLVHQERSGIAHDGARQRHTLALAARELARAPVEQVIDLEDRRDLADLRRDVGAGSTFRIHSG